MSSDCSRHPSHSLIGRGTDKSSKAWSHLRKNLSTQAQTELPFVIVSVDPISMNVLVDTHTHTPDAQLPAYCTSSLGRKARLFLDAEEPSLSSLLFETVCRRRNDRWNMSNISDLTSLSLCSDVIIYVRSFELSINWWCIDMIVCSCGMIDQ